jgi:hypothetical protein
MAAPIPRGYHLTGYKLVVTPQSPTARTARRETRLAERITDPIIVPASLWQRPDTTDALRPRDMRRLFHLLRQHALAAFCPPNCSPPPTENGRCRQAELAGG